MLCGHRSIVALFVACFLLASAVAAQAATVMVLSDSAGVYLMDTATGAVVQSYGALFNGTSAQNIAQDLSGNLYVTDATGSLVKSTFALDAVGMDDGRRADHEPHGDHDGQRRRQRPRVGARDVHRCEGRDDARRARRFHGLLRRDEEHGLLHLPDRCDHRSGAGQRRHLPDDAAVVHGDGRRGRMRHHIRGAQTVVATVTNLSAGATATLNVIGTPNATSGTAVNTARASVPFDASQYGGETLRSTSITTTFTVAALAKQVTNITQSLGPGVSVNAKPGDVLEYTLTFTNRRAFAISRSR
jgi:hypothetical protein